MSAKNTTISNQKKQNASVLKNSFTLSNPRVLLFVFLFAFGVIGGGYLLLQTQAASYPPSQFRQFIRTGSVDIPSYGDNIKGEVQCISAARKTTDSYRSRCIQQVSSTKWRVGDYDIFARKFYPTDKPNEYTATTKYGYSPIRCNNHDYFFVGSQYLITGYGTLSYGEVYRFTFNWEVAAANRSNITGNCSIATGFSRASSLDFNYTD